MHVSVNKVYRFTVRGLSLLSSIGNTCSAAVQFAQLFFEKESEQ